MSLQIRTTLAPHGPATAIELSDDQVATLGGGKRAAVLVTIDGRSARLRLAVEIGDEIEASIELDEAPREVEVPVDLAEALATVAGARAAFDKLPYTHRKEHVQAILGAKKPETRSRRIEATLAKLSPG